MSNKNIFITKFLESSRGVKRTVSLLFDSIAILFSIALTFRISSIDFSNSETEYYNYFVLIITLTLSLIIFAKTGFYRAILRYMGLKAVLIINLGIALSTIVFAFTSIYSDIPIKISGVLLYWSFSLFLIGGARLIVLTYIRISPALTRTKVAIYGAGRVGHQLSRALSQGEKYYIAAFIDDEPSILDTEIDGVLVYSSRAEDIENLISNKGITQVLMAIPELSHTRRSEILYRLEPFPVKVKTVSSMEEIISGHAQIDQLKDIEIEDLLGRDSVEPNSELLHSCITSKNVMVTGAGGSIGSELCRQIITLSPITLVLYEQSEYALYLIEKELRTYSLKKSLNVEIVPLLGSVRNKDRMIRILRKFKIHTLYHAAAYKHVPMVEHNIVEGIRNNIFGTWYTAEAAVETGIERFVLISTDKAVRPTNVMGASKRFAELVLQAINSRGSETIVTMVRFGNVLGSSGSVVPLFREQIKSGGPITVTHKDIVRYFMTIPEAAQLVIQAGAMGKGGDVFVLDMGAQVKISELAERMIHLMGLTVNDSKNPQGDIRIQYSGLRPGEKLYEELLIGENVEGTSHPKIMTANEDMLCWDDMKKALNLMDKLCDEMDCDGITQLLLDVPTGYNPQYSVFDLLWDSNNKNDNVVPLKTQS